MSVKANVPYLKVIPIPSPAAGAELSIFAPGSDLWRITSLRFTLVTSVAVANRLMRLRATDGAGVYFSSPAVAVQAAGATQSYSAFEGSSGNALTAADELLSWPGTGLWLMPGNQLTTQSDLIDVADQYGNGFMFVEVFENGPDFEWTPTIARAMYPRS